MGPEGFDDIGLLNVIVPERQIGFAPGGEGGGGAGGISELFRSKIFIVESLLNS